MASSKRVRSQSALFNKIWKNRPHRSQVSGDRLHGKKHPQWHWQFAHILPKGRYPKFKLAPVNVVLLTPEEHNLFDNETHKIYDEESGLAISPAWQKVFTLRDELRRMYQMIGPKDDIDEQSIVLPKLKNL